MNNLHTYLPQDRRRALARGEQLPGRAHGSVLFADISGFTPLTETLRNLFGSRRGAEELTTHLNAIYTALIAQIERYGGSVTGFAGDSITCWFGDGEQETGDEGQGTAARAVACGLALQEAMRPFHTLALSADNHTSLSIKIAIASGSVRRFVVGNPTYGYLDTLAGATVARMAVGEHLAQKGEVIVDLATADALGSALTSHERRTDPETHTQFVVVESITPAEAMPIAEETPLHEPSLWQAWLHPLVYAREQVGQASFLTEFRPCIALFIRFVGLDYDSHEAGAQLDTFIRQIQAIAAQYDGTLLHLIIGDKGSYIYLNFGALSAHEDDPRRALKTATAVRQAAQELSWLAPLQIGLAQGVMWTGAYGGSTRRTYSAFGDEVNMAARLMQTAAPNEILVSGRIQQTLATDFTFEPRPPISLKGKADPIPVFALLGERQRRPIRLQEPAYALPIVGRQVELQTITAKLALAQQGQAQIIGLIAEAGLGKSRLAAEVIRIAHHKGFVGYGGACQSDGMTTPYLVWKTIWSAFFDIDPAAPLRKQLRLLEGELEERAPQRLESLPLLGQLLNLPLPDNDFTKALAPKDRKGALHALLEDCLKTAAQDQPLLIVIEDLHWIDALSHDLLDELARATTNLSICFLLAYRPPELARLMVPRLESLPAFTKIELRELTAAEAEQSIRAKLTQLYPARSGAVPPALVAKLMARTQGNPFFLEELLNFLRDRGLDPLNPADLDKIELPDSLHSLILSRIDQLTEGQKMTLRVASVVGRLFRADWLTGYYPSLGNFAQVKANLHQLHTLDITPLDTPEPELAYLFRHIVTHEVTYESLPFATRARLHEQLAAYLEQAAESQQVTSRLDTIAHHYGHSHNTAKQREYFQKAGDASQAAFANDAALDYFTRLLALLTEQEEQLEALLKLGAIQELTGQWGDAEGYYRAGLALTQTTPAAKARCQQALASLLQKRGDFGEALTCLAQAQATWAMLGNQTAVGHTAVEMGGVYWRKGEYGQARHHIEEGLALARSANDQRVMTLALNLLGNVLFTQGDPIGARPLYEESLALRRQLGDQRGIADSLNNLGAVALKQGDYPLAQALFEESLALKREMGDKPNISIALNNLGVLASQQGNHAAAQALYEESLALKSGMDDKPGIVLAKSNLGLVAVAQQQYPQAHRWHSESLILAHAIGDKLHIVYNLVGMAAVALGVGNALRAARVVATAETLLNNIQGALEPLIRNQFEQTLAATQAALDIESFARAWAAGGQLSLEEAVTYALEEPTE